MNVCVFFVRLECVLCVLVHYVDFYYYDFSSIYLIKENGEKKFEMEIMFLLRACVQSSSHFFDELSLLSKVFFLFHFITLDSLIIIIIILLNKVATLAG